MRKMMNRKQPDVITKEPGSGDESAGGGPSHNFGDATWGDASWMDGYRQRRGFSDWAMMAMLVFGTLIARYSFIIMTASGDSEYAKMVVNISFFFIVVSLICDNIASFVIHIPEDHSKQRGSFYSAMKMFIPTLTAIFAWCSFIVMTASGIPEEAKMLVIIGFHLIAVFLVARIIAFFAFPKDHSD